MKQSSPNEYRNSKLILYGIDWNEAAVLFLNGQSTFSLQQLILCIIQYIWIYLDVPMFRQTQWYIYVYPMIRSVILWKLSWSMGRRYPYPLFWGWRGKSESSCHPKAAGAAALGRKPVAPNNANFLETHEDALMKRHFFRESFSMFQFSVKQFR